VGLCRQRATLPGAGDETAWSLGDWQWDSLALTAAPREGRAAKRARSGASAPAACASPFAGGRACQGCSAGPPPTAAAAAAGAAGPCQGASRWSPLRAAMLHCRQCRLAACARRTSLLKPGCVCRARGVPVTSRERSCLQSPARATAACNCQQHARGCGVQAMWRPAQALGRGWQGVRLVRGAARCPSKGTRR